MPSPGRQRGGGSRSGQSGPRGGRGGRRASSEVREGQGRTKTQRTTQSEGFSKSQKVRGGKTKAGKGVGWLRDPDLEIGDKGYKTNKELRAERRAMTSMSGPVTSASKAQKARMQKTLAKQGRKKAAAKETKKRQIKADSSKTPGETKPKRTGAPWVRMMPAGYFGGGGKR